MRRPVCARRRLDDEVKPMLLALFNDNYQVYGRRKMKAALRRAQHRARQGPDREVDA